MPGVTDLPSDCVLFYSWSEVRTYDRFADEMVDDAAAERSRDQVREMFSLAQAQACRHQTLVGYFGEQLPACETDCDWCLGLDLVREAKVVAGRQKKSKLPARPGAESVDNSVDGELFESLRAMRKKLADERGVPAYVVFSDATLAEMAARKPQSTGELALISGVGPTKLTRYGENFLELLKKSSASSP